MDKMPIVEDFEEEIDKETGETNPNFIYDEKDNPSMNGMGEDIEVKENQEILETQPSPPTKMTKEEIFDLPSPKKEKVRVSPKKDKKERKKRPPMTEEHKEKLKKAREKALETRRRNAQEKKEMKELEKKAKQKKKDNLKKFVEDDEVVENKPQIIEKTIKQDIDVEKAVLDGIMKYETIRKQRKKKKQEEQAVQRDRDKLKKQINNAIQPQGAVFHGDKGYFDNCF
jgi:hypothetical protein